jgi:Leucine-rich repeat (LRR) protein
MRTRGVGMGKRKIPDDVLQRIEELKWIGSTELDLSFTTVKDLSPLCDLSFLQSLNLYKTQVSDLSPLSGLTSLQNLNLYKTQGGKDQR